MPPISLLDQWIARRQSLDLSQPLLQVDPQKNVLVGWPTISQYLGVKSWATFYQWIEIYGFPAIKRPDGMWMTTMTAIDQWIFLAAEADNEARPHSRGSGKRVDIALRRLQERATERALRVASGQDASLPDGPRVAHGAYGPDEQGDPSSLNPPQGDSLPPLSSAPPGQHGSSQDSPGN